MLLYELSHCKDFYKAACVRNPVVDIASKKLCVNILKSYNLYPPRDAFYFRYSRLVCGPSIISQNFIDRLLKVLYRDGNTI